MWRENTTKLFIVVCNYDDDDDDDDSDLPNTLFL